MSSIVKFKPLNQELHRQLRGRFGTVKIANPGQSTPISRLGTKYKVHGGEFYCVCCPECDDTKYKLWISYKYGTVVKGKIMTSLAICYRCGKPPEGLYDMIKQLGGKPLVSEEKFVVNVADFTVSEADYPDFGFTRLVDLDGNHPCIDYLETRGFNPAVVDEQLGWRLAEYVPFRSYNYRLFIPVYHVQDGKEIFVGYQLRAIPRFSVTDTPKYWTMPGFSKSAALYNLQNAVKQDVVVITEGAFDAAKVGVSGVALFGKKASIMQKNLICELFKGKDVVIMLDADAVVEGSQLFNDLNSGVFKAFPFRSLHKVNLLTGDPGEKTTEYIWQQIKEKLR